MEKRTVIIISLLLLFATTGNTKPWQDYDIYTTPVDGDHLLVNDVSDPTDNAAGTVKRLAWLYVQPRDYDLTAIATEYTTAYGRALLALANEAALKALITTPWTVPYGGTGAAYLTDGGVLLGSGAGAVTPMAVLLDGQMIVGDGTTDPVAESGATLRTSIGVGTGDSPQFTGIELGHATENTLTGSGGQLSVEGNVVYRASGTDVPVTDGGTGRSTSTTAYGLIAAGTTATGAHQTLAAGGTDEILVGGGASALPVWTTANGTGAPVRATGATLVAPTLGVADATTLNTGEGDNELFDMDQNVLTTSDTTFSSATADLYRVCNTSEPASYVFGQVVCADAGAGSPWNPTGTDWSGFTAAEKKHLVQKIQPAAEDCVLVDDPHDCCTAVGEGTGCEETWIVVRDALGNRYISGIEMATYADANDYTIAAEDAYMYTYFATGAGNWTLPPLASGMNICLENHTSSTVNLYPVVTEYVKLNGGTTLTVGYGIKGETVGDKVCCSYYSAGVWSCFDSSATSSYVSTGAVGGGSSCPAYYADTNVTFSWNGDHSSGTDYGCRAAGTTIQASGSLTPHTDYGEGGSYGVDLDGSNGLVFAVSGDTEIDDTIGTIWIRAKMVAEANSVTMMELYGGSLANSFAIYKTSADPDVGGLFELDGGGVTAFGNQVPTGSFVDVAYSWNVVPADPGEDDHAAWGLDGTGWEEDANELVGLDLADITELIIGEKNYTSNGAPITYLYIDRIAVLSTYKAGKPANWNN